MKIRYRNANRLKKEATGREMSLYMTFAQFQDDTTGIVVGIKETEIREQLSLGEKTFYKLMQGLKSKGFIEIDYNTTDRAMWTVTLIDNALENGVYDAFININNALFHTHEFHKMKKNSKTICISLL